MSGITVASLSAKISADASQFKRELGGARDSLNAFGKTNDLIGKGLKLAAGVGIAAVGALSVGMAAATNRAADMEQQVANITAVMGLNAEQVKELNGLIMDLGLDPKLKVSAVEAAQAIEMLGKNGLTMDQIMNGAARSTVLLANSTGADFATAADLATDVMIQFGISAENMSAAVNGITGTTVASKFDINDYRLAIAQAGGVASSVGVSFDDFNATIAAISPLFASGSDAGTSFKTFLQTLVPKSADAAEMMQQLGLEFFDANGQMKDMNAIAHELQDGFSGLSEEQKNNAASTIFGTDAMRTAFALANAGAGEIDRLKGIIGNTSAEKSAATRMNTFRGAVEILGGVIESISISIGQSFLPIFGKLVRAFTDFISGKSERIADWFELLAFNIQRFIDNVVAAWASGDPLGALFESFSKLWELITTGNFQGGIFGQTEDSPLIGFFLKLHEILDTTVLGVIKVKDVLAALGILLGVTIVRAVAAWIASMWPVAAVFAAIVLAVAAFRLAWETDFGGIQEKTRAVLDWLQARFGPLLDVIRQFGGEALGEIVAWVMGTGNEFSALSAIWDTVKETFRLVWQDVRGVLDQWGAKIKEWAGIAWDWLGQNFPKTAGALKQAWEGIKTSWQGLWAVLKPLIDKGKEWFDSLVSTWNTGSRSMSGDIDKAKVLIDLALSTIVTIVGTAFANIIDKVKLITQLVTGDWAGAWQTAQDIFWRTWDMIKTILGNAIAAIDVLFGTTLGEWQGDWQTAWAAISGAVSGAMAAIAAFLMPYLQEWGDKITEWAGIAWAGFAERFPQAADALTKAWDGIKTAWRELWDVIKTGLKSMQDGVVKWEGSLDWSVALRNARTIVDTAFANIVTIVSTAIQNIINTVKLIVQLVNGDWKGAWQTAKDIVQRTWDAIKQIVKNTLQAIDDIFETDFAQMARDFYQFGRDLLQGLWDGLKEMWRPVQQWLDDRWRELQRLADAAWGRHSPSTWFYDFGSDLMQGLANGIDAKVSTVMNSVASMGDKVKRQVSAITTALETETGKWYGGDGSGNANAGNPITRENNGAFNSVTPMAPRIDKFIDQAAGIFGYAARTWLPDVLGDFSSDLMGLFTGPGQNEFIGVPVRNALATLSDPNVENTTTSGLIAAIQLLVAEIRTRGLGSNFNLAVAPAMTGDTAADIRATVEYLQALYA